MKHILKYLVLFCIFGITYYIIEILYRGFSHWTMFILAGILGCSIGLINEVLSWETPLWLQGMVGSVLVTLLELVFGMILNVWLELNIWDYSKLKFNLFGQICLQFSLAWFALSLVAIIIDDYLRYYLFKEEKPRYKVF